MEANPKQFLDTSINSIDGEIFTSVYTKKNKLPVFWSSKIPKRYKRNAIKGELHRASKISSSFNAEVDRIRHKFLKVGFPKRFIESVIKDFQGNTDDELLIPEWLFDERIVKTLRLPYCLSNESLCKPFMDRLQNFTNHKFKFIIIWDTRNVRSLFPLKDRVKHRSCVIYQGVCSCGISYTGETNRIASIRWKEHENPLKDSEPSKHLVLHPTHEFTWNIISSAPQSSRKRKILEAFYIAKHKPRLIDQLQSAFLLLFKYGVT